MQAFTINTADNEALNKILDAIFEGAEFVEDDEPCEELSAELKRALELKKQYDAFIEVGFDEIQATEFIAALLH